MIIRGCIFFFGIFLAANLLVGTVAGSFDANHWWFDLRALPRTAANSLLAASAICAVTWSIQPRMGRWRRRMTLLSLGLLILAAIINSIVFYRLLTSGAIHSSLPFPLSGLLAIVGILLLTQGNRGIHREAFFPRIQFATGFVICAVLTPLLQIFFFGTTDYRRNADAAVVFGARAYADGRPSDALADRVRAACKLYHERRVRWLIFSGGPEDGAIHEADSMRTLAKRLNVPDEAIILDRDGLNTAATVAGSIRIADAIRAPRLLAVSHFYHLPRIKLEFERQGRYVHTVPASQARTLNSLPRLVVRELAALWVYYLRIPSAPSQV